MFERVSFANPNIPSMVEIFKQLTKLTSSTSDQNDYGQIDHGPKEAATD